MKIFLTILCILTMPVWGLVLLALGSVFKFLEIVWRTGAELWRDLYKALWGDQSRKVRVK